MDGVNAGGGSLWIGEAGAVAGDRDRGDEEFNSGGGGSILRRDDCGLDEKVWGGGGDRGTVGGGDVEPT